MSEEVQEADNFPEDKDCESLILEFTEMPETLRQLKKCV